MKKIAFYTLWTILCLHTTVSFTDAASGSIDDALAEIDAIIAESESPTIEINSAPSIFGTTPTHYQEPQTWSAWELVHRTPMLQGFMWTGAIAEFVTPNMYLGTPIQTNMSQAGYDVELGPTNYAECVRAETDASFGPIGMLLEADTQRELMNMAKYCATEYYGTYFEGKEYTTREEMLMLIFTMFDEGITLPGYFDDDGFVFEGEETITPYSNVSSHAWFAPYISIARELNMIGSYTEWSTAQAVTSDDIADMLNAFSEYRTMSDGNVTTGGRIIQTYNGYYMLDWVNGSLTLRKNH